MDEKLLKRMAACSFTFMMMIVIISSVVSNYNYTLTYAGSSDLISKISSGQEDRLNGNKLQSGHQEDNKVTKQLGDKYILIKKPDKSEYTVNLEDLYMERAIRLTVTGPKGKEINPIYVERMNQGQEFTGIPSQKSDKDGKKDKTSEETDTLEEEINQESNLLVPEKISATGQVSAYITNSSVQDPVKDLSIEYRQKEGSTSSTAIINISLDCVYAFVIYQDDNYIYVDLRRPKDVYDKIVVIDAGHGGKDGGTYSKDKEYFEKDVNLSIVLKLKEILDKKDIKVYYTRTEDKTLYLNPRVNFANEVEADLFISIHCNSSESSKPQGAEVLYNENQTGYGFTSKRLAEIALEEISPVIGRVNRGIVPGSEMVIVGKSKVPVALIEVAFMSNQEDLNFLVQEDNKTKIAEAIYKGIVRALREKEN